MKETTDVGHARPDLLSFDSASLRRKDENGFLHVACSPISKEAVNPYYGREIPGWQEMGLQADRLYQGYRPGTELQKGAATFNGLPVLLDHQLDSASDPQKDLRVGSLGTDAAFDAPYLTNSITITDSAAIAAIEEGSHKQISAAYRYDPVLCSGEFNGQAYDFMMTNIRGNHIALVEQGRAGPDVVVADSCPAGMEASASATAGTPAAVTVDALAAGTVDALAAGAVCASVAITADASAAGAFDAESFRRETEQKFAQKMRAMQEAVAKVAPLAAFDPLAFDSAEDVYRKALELGGIDAGAYPSAAWEGMCEVYLTVKQSAALSLDLATDSATGASGSFKHFNNIRVEG